MHLKHTTASFKLLIFSVLLVFSFSAKSQQCMTFQDMEKMGLRISTLDSSYQNAMLVDSGGFFKWDAQKDFSKAWAKFYEDFFNYLAKKKFKWGNPTWCFLKVYFTTQGKIDYWFFNFHKEDNIPKEKQDAFLKHMRNFSKKYKIAINANKPFTACSSVTFIDL